MPGTASNHRPQTALLGARLILPGTELHDHALIISGPTISAIVPHREVPRILPSVDLSGTILAPGFVDLQVNGGGGVLFNDAPTTETIETIAAAHRTFGTTSLLPTLISDKEDKMHAAIAATRDAISAGSQHVLGLHLEGPFLAPAKRGIHNDAHFLPLSEEWLQQLTSTGIAHLLVTVAPERVPASTLKALKDAGIRISAGHTEANYDQAIAAIQEGVTGFTHLFNAMPPMLSRAPGPIAAALESDAWCMLIADGHHVSTPMLNLVVRAKQDGRIILVTDAMGCVGTNQNEFTFEGEQISVRDGRCTNADGTLAGSALTMIGAVRQMTEAAQLPLHQTIRMATLEPARFMGVDHLIGSLQPGLRGDLVVLDENLEVITTVIAGDLHSLTETF